MPWGKQGFGNLEEHRRDLKLPVVLPCNITGQQLTGSGHRPEKKKRAGPWYKSGDHIHKDPLLMSTICFLVMLKTVNLILCMQKENYAAMPSCCKMMA